MKKKIIPYTKKTISKKTGKSQILSLKKDFQRHRAEIFFKNKCKKIKLLKFSGILSINQKNSQTNLTKIHKNLIFITKRFLAPLR